MNRQERRKREREMSKRPREMKRQVQEGIAIQTTSYGDGEDDWVYVASASNGKDSEDPETVQLINDMAEVLRTYHHQRTVSWPQVLELAARFVPLVDWSTKTLDPDGQGGGIKVRRGPEFDAVVRDATRWGIPLPLVARTANETRAGQPLND
jgi:hypothetical protein